MNASRWIRAVVAVAALSLGLAILPSASAATLPDLKPVTIAVSGAEAANVLQMMAKMAKMSLVADSSVKGAITVSFKNVPLNFALDYVCQSNGWGWTRVGDTIVVTDSAKAAKDAIAGYEVQVFPLKFADPADLEPKLVLALPADQIKVDARTNSIILTGTEQELAKAARLIATLDTQIPQVSVVARVEELSKDALANIGIDWKFDGQSISIGYQGGALQGGVDYQAILGALEKTNSARSLANSGVTTLDGVEASILLGDKIPVVTETVTDGKVVKTYQFVDIGVKLLIKPRVNGSDKVTISLTPEISSMTGTTSDGYPTLSTREVHTTVTLRDGETIAIGGLFKREDYENVTKLPVLGSLPFLGSLFTQKKSETRDSEVVVFITPHLVFPSEVAVATKGNPYEAEPLMLPTTGAQTKTAMPPKTTTKAAPAATQPGPTPPAAPK